jgi:hypothetical protein
MNETADFSDPPPLEPPRPEDYECCGNGCEPCVFDLHAQAVDRWRSEMKAWRARQAARAEAPPSEATPADAPPAAAAPTAAAVPALCRPSSP